jgi:CubicO group peptidase (beta-lactamase class C family)
MPRENAKEANVMVARRLVLLGLVAAGLASALPLAARTPESRAVTLDAQLQQLVASRTTPGVAVLILQDGKSAYERAVGVRDPRGGEPLRTDRLFRLASMTKPVTSVAAMMLVEDGRIGLDDPLSKHLPQFAGLQVRRADGGLEPARRPPTIRELLTHTAGFSYTFMNRPGIVDAYREARVVDGLSDPAVTLGEAMWRLAGAPLAFQPGTEWHYSLATDVLGAVIERVSGQPLDAFVLERIARPLGLASWTFHAPEAARERLVVVTAPQQGGGTRLVASPDPVPFPATHGTALLDPERAFSATAYPSGGAGMIGTIGDYARFLQMLLNGGELDGVRLLRPETVRQMTSNQTGGKPVSLRGPGWGYGLGVAVLLDSAAGQTALPAGSYNWGGIYGTGFWVDPVNRVVGVVASQTAIIGSGPAITGAVREAYYTAE